MNYRKHVQENARTVWPLGLGLVLGTAALCGQTQVDLRTQTRRVDFTQAPMTAPVKTGNAFPATCAMGELFFYTDGPIGRNLYGCTSTNTWTLEGDGGGGGGGGATSFSELTDLKVALSGSTYTIAAGRVSFGDSTSSFVAATLTESDPDDTGTIYFCAEYNAGSPRLLTVIPAAFTGANYTPINAIAVTGTSCPTDSVVLATAAMVSGTPGAPLDFRPALSLAASIQAGNGLFRVVTDGGRSRTISIDTTSVVRKFSGAGVPGNISASTLGDLYVDTSSLKVYSCVKIGDGCNGVAAGQWVLLN
jgi:hypothetical protein